MRTQFEGPVASLGQGMVKSAETAPLSHRITDIVDSTGRNLIEAYHVSVRLLSDLVGEERKPEDFDRPTSANGFLPLLIERLERQHDMSIVILNHLANLENRIR